MNILSRGSIAIHAVKNGSLEGSISMVNVQNVRECEDHCDNTYLKKASFLLSKCYELWLTNNNYPRNCNI